MTEKKRNWADVPSFHFQDREGNTVNLKGMGASMTFPANPPARIQCCLDVYDWLDTHDKREGK